MQSASFWEIWLIITLLLLIVEAFFPTFLAASLAFGCVLSALLAFIGSPLKIQLCSFSLGTILSFFFARPFMIKYAHKRNVNFETNVYALVGKTGKVIVTIDHLKNQGRVMVEGDNWKAATEDETLIDEGQNVEILKVNSTTLIVKLYKKT
jgi:membrane protein implicated in regulation of membrane protease activity